MKKNEQEIRDRIKEIEKFLKKYRRLDDMYVILMNRRYELRWVLGEVV